MAASRVPLPDWIIPRERLNLRPWRSRRFIALPTLRLWFHHTGVVEGAGVGRWRIHQDFHMDVRRWQDVAYSFGNDANGTLCELRGVGIAGGHTAGQNTVSHALCTLGHYGRQRMTTRAVNSAIRLCRWGVGRYWRPNFDGHRNAPGANTDCPGHDHQRHIPAIRRAVTAPQAAPPQPDRDPDEDHDDQEDDMVYLTREPGTNQIFLTNGRNWKRHATQDQFRANRFSGVPFIEDPANAFADLRGIPDITVRNSRGNPA